VLFADVASAYGKPTENIEFSDWDRVDPNEQVLLLARECMQDATHFSQGVDVVGVLVQGCSGAAGMQ
jgi:hypothetical protein